MSEDVFRWVITSGVVICSLTILVMAGALIGVYRTTRRMESRLVPLIDKAMPILDRARTVMDDSGIRIRDILDKVSDIISSVRGQVQKIESLVDDTTDQARVQLDRLDQVVNETLSRVQQTSAAVQGTILKPVREVNGVVSGVRAAIGILARRNRASVDHATQDEEMFI